MTTTRSAFEKAFQVAHGWMTGVGKAQQATWSAATRHLELMTNTYARLWGRETEDVLPADKRFEDDAWRENLAFDLNVSTSTPEDAKNMEQIVQGLIAMANMQKEDIPADIKLPEDIFIQTKGNSVRMGFTYPVDYIIELISKRAKFPHGVIKKHISSLT